MRLDEVAVLGVDVFESTWGYLYKVRVDCNASRLLLHLLHCLDVDVPDLLLD